MRPTRLEEHPIRPTVPRPSLVRIYESRQNTRAMIGALSYAGNIPEYSRVQKVTLAKNSTSYEEKVGISKRECIGILRSLRWVLRRCAVSRPVSLVSQVTASGNDSSRTQGEHMIAFGHSEPSSASHTPC